MNRPLFSFSVGSTFISRRTNKRTPWLVLACTLSFFVVGCGDDDAVGDGGLRDTGTQQDTGPLPMCGMIGRSGETDCLASPAGRCAAGQYCDSERLTCSPGCTSDANCGSTDHCVRPAGQATGVCQACPRCGDTLCQPGEDATSCPADCGTACGDGVCQPTENNTSCPADCPPSVVCGDGVCQPTENNTSCPADCPLSVVCGDGVCQPSESAASCPADCAMSPLDRCLATCEGARMCGGAPGNVDQCRANCGALSPADQSIVGDCRDDDCARMANCLGVECFSDAQCSAGSCLNATCCGNGVCNVELEDESTCPTDCARDFLAECYEECDGFAFFGCGIGCRDACTASTPSRRNLFLECANPAACNYESCSEFL